MAKHTISTLSSRSRNTSGPADRTVSPPNTCGDREKGWKGCLAQSFCSKSVIFSAIPFESGHWMVGNIGQSRLAGPRCVLQTCYRGVFSIKVMPQSSSCDTANRGTCCSSTFETQLRNTVCNLAYENLLQLEPLAKVSPFFAPFVWVLVWVCLQMGYTEIPCLIIIFLINMYLNGHFGGISA